MSGGHFEYLQFQFEGVADEINRLIETNKSEKITSYGTPEGLFYSDEVIEKFKEGEEFCRKAAIYVQRIDWLVSGDDGEDSFLSRLEEDLKRGGR